ncbi:hypothetical protein GCM10011391_09920 [Pullulanibacillus camelliae]|uniref:Uncharacterized protein n=1 Tax=Pullulanibacillus camelliae TaxID=1707096 RepID=A0A8J2VMG3_9BACL|nr:hypothetical protein [Pullulanibacillus camelliae]GGE33279.1 hypothetical protein GCM10011391_09920 [Pullulanibacillus camelliae]
MLKTVKTLDALGGAFFAIMGILLLMNFLGGWQNLQFNEFRTFTIALGIAALIYLLVGANYFLLISERFHSQPLLLASLVAIIVISAIIIITGTHTPFVWPMVAGMSIVIFLTLMNLSIKK